MMDGPKLWLLNSRNRNTYFNSGHLNLSHYFLNRHIRYFKQIESFVNNAYKTETVYPPRHELFNAFSSFRFVSFFFFFGVFKFLKRLIKKKKKISWASDYKTFFIIYLLLFLIILDLTPIEKVKVCIIGQGSFFIIIFQFARTHDTLLVDPYFNPNQAHGLCFSVRRGVKVPPSLNRIYKLLNKTERCTIPKHGELTEWAERGVLMLNATLSVRGGKANSHKDAGWQRFTDAAIAHLSRNTKHVVFILWGRLLFFFFFRR
jgi:uracil DNA glycosylase